MTRLARLFAVVAFVLLAGVSAAGVSSTPNQSIFVDPSGRTTTGDFNGDGFSDVVSIVPSPSYGATGVVTVLFGSAGGLPPDDSSGWHASISGATTVAVGNLDAGNFDDLIIGSPDLRKVFVYLGDPNFPTRPPGDGANANRTAVPDDSSPFGPGFGSAIAAGDISGGDGADELIVGWPGWNNDSNLFGSGKVYVWKGGV